jgi:small-conductance mechanosensitive channel
MLRNAALLVFAAATLLASGVVGRLCRSVGDGLFGSFVRFALKVVLPVALLTVLFQVVARGLGYVPLAEWVLDRVVVTLAQVALVVFGHRLSRRALRHTLTLDGAKVEGDAPSPAAIGTERIAAGFLWLAFVTTGGLWVLSTWDLGPGRLSEALDERMFPGSALLWGEALGGALRVAVVLLASWLLRNVLTFFVFPRAQIDVGVRYAVLAMLRYTVVVLVVFFALSALGVETSSLAWFLGAAGVGLGLGLQDVLGNFFSGLVMLVERPIRVGDFVVVGDAAGTVEAIRIRGTVIRTPENTTVLVPNRQMLGDRVTNFTYGTGYRRLQVQVGVAYDSDPEQVRRILLAIAARHPLVRTDPAPFVQLSSFGTSSLDFTLFAQSSSPLDVFQVASDLRFQVLAEFRRAHIEIPFPQHEIHLRPELPSRAPGGQ